MGFSSGNEIDRKWSGRGLFGRISLATMRGVRKRIPAGMNTCSYAVMQGYLPFSHVLLLVPSLFSKTFF